MFSKLSPSSEVNLRNIFIIAGVFLLPSCYGDIDDYSVEDVFYESGELTVIAGHDTGFGIGIPGPYEIGIERAQKRLLRMQWKDPISEPCKVTVTKFPKNLNGTYGRAKIAGEKIVVNAYNLDTGQDYIIFSPDSDKREIIKCGDITPCMLFSNNRRFYVYDNKVFSASTKQIINHLNTTKYEEFKKKAESNAEAMRHAGPRYFLADDGKYIVSRNLIYDIEKDVLFDIEIPAEFNGKLGMLGQIIPTGNLRVKYLYTEDVGSDTSTYVYSYPERSLNMMDTDITILRGAYWNFEEGKAIGVRISGTRAEIRIYDHKSRELIEKKLCIENK